MDILRVELLNPKANALLKSLADLNLIRISEPVVSKQHFFDLLSDLRKDDAPSLDEIQKEVKAVRKQLGKKK